MVKLSCLSSQVREEFWVGIDPGSVSVGLSLFHRGSLADYRVIRTDKSASAETRILKLNDSVVSALTLMLGFAPKEQTHAVLELPGQQSKQRAGNLIALGMAVGSMACVLHAKNFASLDFIDVSTWSRLDGGVCKAKHHRANYLPTICPQYAPADDDGLDAADAIGIVAWRLGLYEGHRERIKDAVKLYKVDDIEFEKSEVIRKAAKKKLAAERKAERLAKKSKREAR